MAWAMVNVINRRSFGWSFDINPNYTQMDFIREWVKLIHGVPMILDHCGKPGIAEGAIAQYRDDVGELSQHPNLWIKLSDLPVEADHRRRRERDGGRRRQGATAGG